MTILGTITDSLARRIAIIVAFLAIAALLISIFVWRDSRDARARLQATVDDAKKTIADAGDRENARDAQLKQALAAISAIKDRVHTPAQAAAAIPAALPQLPEPIRIELPTPKAGQSLDAQADRPPGPSTSGPAVASIPQVDLKPLLDAAEDCRACQLKLSAAQANLSDQTAKLAATSAERDAALKVARGGSTWARVKHAAKWIIIGAGVGAIAARAAH